MMLGIPPHNPMQSNRPDSGQDQAIQACHDFDLQQYPTVMWLSRAQQVVYPYERHTLHDMSSFIDGMVRLTPTTSSGRPLAPTKVETEIFASRLNGSTFRAQIRSSPGTLVMFYMHGCGHCADAMVPYELTAHEWQSEIRDESEVRVSKIDCSGADAEAFCESLGVKAFPSFRYYRYGEESAQYAREERTTSSFLAFLEQMAGVPDEERWGKFGGEPTTTKDDKADEKEDTEEDINAIVKIKTEEQFQLAVGEGIVLVEFIEPECARCEELEKPLRRIAYGLDFVPELLVGRLQVAQVDCSLKTSRSICLRFFENALEQGRDELSNIPAFALYSGGELLSMMSGKEDVGLLADLFQLIPLPKMEL